MTERENSEGWRGSNCAGVGDRSGFAVSEHWKSQLCLGNPTVLGQVIGQGLPNTVEIFQRESCLTLERWSCHKTAHVPVPLQASRGATPGAHASSVRDEDRGAAVAVHRGRHPADTLPALVLFAEWEASLPLALRDLQDARRRLQLEEENDEFEDEDDEDVGEMDVTQSRFPAGFQRMRMCQWFLSGTAGRGWGVRSLTGRVNCTPGRDEALQTLHIDSVVAVFFR